MLVEHFFFDKMPSVNNTHKIVSRSDEILFSFFPRETLFLMTSKKNCDVSRVQAQVKKFLPSPSCTDQPLKI